MHLSFEQTVALMVAAGPLLSGLAHLIGAIKGRKPKK
ncbi:hypothetical protein DAIF1_17050 [Stenotrophomonas indicatrix]|nr:hypothetical protein DAIF1_17050 [Stenotrophomonas indicatrix]